MNINLRDIVAIQCQRNMKRDKGASVIWGREKLQRDDQLLNEIEDNLEALYNNDGFDYLLETSKEEIFSETRK